MQTTGKCPESPMDRILLGEGGMGSLAVRGEDVYLKPGGRVRLEWLTACKEERALTGDLMEEMYPYG